MASTLSQSPFEAMPLELHFKVLSHLSGPEDVLSTIRASPAALRALQTGRETIYAAVLQTRLAPEVFREFLAILNAPDHNTCPSVGPRQTDDEWNADRESILHEWTGWELKAGEFLRSHALGAVYLAPSMKSDPTEFKTQTRFMVRLYFCVSRLISYYIPYAGSRVTGTRIDLPPTSADFEWPPLTELELLRMQRGFLRYELCCRLIGMPSIAAYSNTRVFDAVVAEQRRRIRELWEVNPFNRLLPVDEIEEVICASMYIHGLYSRLRCSFVEDFEEAVWDLNHGRDKANSNSKRTKTVREWLSINPLKTDYHPFHWGGKFGRRLGLVFLDRVIRSTPADRRELMRASFHTFRRLGDDTHFLQDSWHNVVYRRGFAEDRDRSSRLEVGPQCNAILKTCSTYHPIIKRLTNLTPSSLRRQGWAFFDGQFEARSLDLPVDDSPRSISEWVEHEFQYPHPVCSVRISGSALATRFTEEEWGLLFEKYSPKDLRDDFQAMSRFLADARAVVDFRSDRVPQMD